MQKVTIRTLSWWYWDIIHLSSEQVAQMKQTKIIKIYEHQFSPGPAAMVFGKNVTIANANRFSGGIWAIECKFQLNNTYLFKNKRGNNPAKFSY